MQTQTIPSYLYLQYADDVSLQAFVSSYNQITQGYVTYLNNINLPIYTGLSGALLDWIGAGYYGYARPTIGVPSGAIFGNSSIFNQVKFGSGSIGLITASDDTYKRILTWKLQRADGMYFTIPFLKKRIKRFLIGVNGTSPLIDETIEVSIKITNTKILLIHLYTTDTTSATLFQQCINAGVLDLPYNYTPQVSIN